MAEQDERTAPIRHSVRVDCPIEEAFELFTERFAEWWPAASYQNAETGTEYCGIEPWVGGRVFERTRSGEESEWGSVIAWEPPRHVAFTWHPGTSGERNQRVDVDFSVEADGTRVTLIHTGWHQGGVEVCALRAECTTQWSDILAAFSRFAFEQMLVAV